MKTNLKLGKLNLWHLFGLLVAFYVLNYLFTPMIVGGADGYGKGCVKLENYYRPRFNQKFDSKIWRESGIISDGKYGKESSSYGKRYKMVDDLLTSHISIGMEEEQIRAFLGNPDCILNKKSILASPDPYGGDKLNPNKEILGSSNNIAYWSYSLAHQWQYPAKSIWFPRIFLNFDQWRLLVKMKDEKVCEFKVIFD